MLFQVKKSLPLALLLMFLLSFSGCEVHPLEEEKHPINLQAEAPNDDDDDCVFELGTLKRFGLNIMQNPEAPSFIPPNPIDSYVYLGPVPPFHTGMGCLCALDSYGLFFDIEPDPSELFIYDDNGSEIAYSGPFMASDGISWYVEIDKVHLKQNVYVAYAPLTYPLPELTRASGLCMIDNVSLPRNPIERTVAYEHAVQLPSGVIIDEIWVGADIGGVSLPPHY